MTEKNTVSFDEALGIEMCNNCSYANNYDLFGGTYYCFEKMQRGNFSICEEHIHNKWVFFKTFLKSWIYLMR